MSTDADLEPGYSRYQISPDDAASTGPLIVMYPRTAIGTAREALHFQPPQVSSGSLSWMVESFNEDEILNDPVTMARLASSDLEIERGELLGIEDIRRTLEARRRRMR